MSEKSFRVEAIASTLLLTAQDQSYASLIDVRPALLAAQLSAHKLCSANGKPHQWQNEFSRVMASLGWRQTLCGINGAEKPNPSGWVVHKVLAWGLARKCPGEWAVPLRQALAQVAAAPEDSKAVQTLRAYGWFGTALNLQVAFLDTDGSLIIYSIYFDAHEPVPAQWLSHPFRPSHRKAMLHTRVVASSFSCELYAPVADSLKTRLGDRLQTAIATV